MSSRLVSLVPSVTETVFDLGAGDRLVAVTRYCCEPADGVGGLPRIGGTKNPALERIAALGPDLVLVNTEENRAQDIAWLRARFPVHESMPRTVSEAAAAVRELGRALEVSECAERCARAIEMALAAVTGAINGPPLRVFYAIWPKPWMSVNRDTYIHDVLRCAGAVNVAAECDARYPSFEPGALAALAADVVLLPDEPYPFTEAWRDELAAASPFGVANAIELTCGKDFCWHGSRAAGALGRVAELLRRLRRSR